MSPSLLIVSQQSKLLKFRRFFVEMYVSDCFVLFFKYTRGSLNREIGKSSQTAGGPLNTLI